MHTPQIIYIILSCFNLGGVLVLHGKNKDEKYNFWFTLLSTILTVALLYWGGFFK